MISLLVPFVGNGDKRRDHLLDATLEWWESHFPERRSEFEIVVGGCVPFSRARARNTAARAAKGEIFIIADADSIPAAGAVKQGVQLVAAGEAPWVIPYSEGRYYNLSEAASDRCIASGEYPEPTDPEDWEHKITSWAGCLIVPREAFETVGGYDDRFIGWGGEDNAFQRCLDVLVGPHKRVGGYILHLWHPRGDADFTQPHWPENKNLLRRYQNARSVQEMRRVRFGEE